MEVSVYSWSTLMLLGLCLVSTLYWKIEKTTDPEAREWMREKGLAAHSFSGRQIHNDLNTSGSLTS